MSTSIELKPDDRWEGVYEISTYQQYLEKLEMPVLLKETADEDVKGLFQLVNKLICLAYFEYELWDLASMKALLAFELALKKRYQHLNGVGVPEGMKLKSLIEWFRKRNYFETDSEHYLDHIRLIRNHLAHPEYHSFGGPMVSWYISAAAGLINDLYEDRELRIQRKEESALLNEKFQNMQQDGFVLTIEGQNPILVYKFILGFVNNKKASKEYHFVYRPAFVIPEQYQKGDSVPNFNAYRVSCCNYKLSGNEELIGYDVTRKQIFILRSAIVDAQNQWLSWFDAYKAYIKVLPHFELSDNRNISEIIGNIKWEFH